MFDLVLEVDLPLDHVQVLELLLVVLLLLDPLLIGGLFLGHVLSLLYQVFQLGLFLLLTTQHIPLEAVVIHCLLLVTLLVVVLVVGLFDGLLLLVIG